MALWPREKKGWGYAALDALPGDVEHGEEAKDWWRYDVKCPHIKCPCNAGGEGATRERQTHAGHQKRETGSWDSAHAHWRQVALAAVSRA